MRVLQINKFLYPRGGAERYMFDVARALARRRHEVVFFAAAHPDNRPSPYSRFFPPYTEFGEGRARLGDAPAAIWSRRAAGNLKALLAEVKPDVAHLHNVAYHLTPAIIPVLARAGVPTVMHLWDYNLVCPNHYCYSDDEPCFRCVERKFLACVARRCVKGRFGASFVGYAAHLVARRTKVYHKVGRLICSARYMRELVLRAGYAEDQVLLFPPSYDVKVTTESRRGDYFLYAGRLAPEKGVDVLIAAVGHAGPKVRLKVAGVGPAAENLRDLAARYAAGKVEFLGFQGGRDLAALMAGARAVVVPSLWPENTPAVVLEAYGAAAPVVASRVGGVPEMVGDGAEGVLFDAGDVHGLAAVLNRLAGDARLARKMGAAGRRRLARDFSFAAQVDRLLEIYREVAA